MKRIVLGVLLDIFAVVALIVVVVLPAVTDIKTIPSVNNMLQSVLCKTPETLRVEQHVYRYRPGSTSYSATYYCENETRQRNVTDTATLMGIAAFVVPLLLGVFLIINGAMGAVKQRTMTAVGMYDLSGMGVNMRVSNLSGLSTMSSGARGSTTDRLKALKQAYDQGLITEAEYETKRQSILNEM